MIRKLALLAGAGLIAKKLLDRSRQDGATGPSEGRFKPTYAATPAPGHVPTDLLGDKHPDGSGRADDHFRPDPTAPVSAEDREGLRPVTLAAPHDSQGR